MICWVGADVIADGITEAAMDIYYYSIVVSICLVELSV
jgi:hypothetical protein